MSTEESQRCGSGVGMGMGLGSSSGLVSGVGVGVGVGGGVEGGSLRVSSEDWLDCWTKSVCNGSRSRDADAEDADRFAFTAPSSSSSAVLSNATLSPSLSLEDIATKVSPACC